MTDSNTSRPRRYLKPVEGCNTLTKEELRVLLDVETVSPSVYDIYRRGKAIICSTTNYRRAGWLRANDESSIEWLVSRDYVEVFPTPEEVLT